MVNDPLFDVNYYRLGYQLAAQRANWSLRTGNPEDAVDRLVAAVGAAQRVTADATTALNELAARATKRRWLGMRAGVLSPREQRLQRFLGETVRPSAAIVAAGSMLLLDDVEASRALSEPVLEQLENNRLSYRALYNVACYFTAIAFTQRSDDFSAALDVLRKSLLAAPSRSRQPTAHWARTDPSLGPMRESRGYAQPFTDLLDRFDPPSAQYA